MLKYIRSFVAKFQNSAVKAAMIALCLTLLVGLPTLPAAADNQMIASIGIKHQTEGALEQGIGKAEVAIGDLKGEVKGLARQADGKAKRNIGRVESKAEQLADKGKKTATNLGEQIQDVAGSIADSVKDLVK